MIRRVSSKQAGWFTRGALSYKATCLVSFKASPLSAACAEGPHGNDHDANAEHPVKCALVQEPHVRVMHVRPGLHSPHNARIQSYQ
eukprot:2316168-Amphidinium_carterae.1